MKKFYNVLIIFFIVGSFFQVSAAPRSSKRNNEKKIITEKKKVAAQIPEAKFNWGVWKNRFELFNLQAKTGKIELLFIGDSITHYWQKNVMCKTDGQESWDKYWGNYYVENFGIGSDRTQHVLYRITNGNLEGIMPKAIVLMIGTNNTSSGHKPEDITLAISDIIKEIATRCPRTRIIIYDIFPRLRNAPQAVENNKQTNLLLKKLADGKRVIHASIYDQLLDKNGNANKDIFFDGIHMTNAGYEIWAKDVIRLLKKYNIKLRSKEKK